MDSKILTTLKLDQRDNNNFSLSWQFLFVPCFNNIVKNNLVIRLERNGL